MSYRLQFFEKLVVNGQEVDEEIDDATEDVRLRGDMTPAEIFEAGRRYGKRCERRPISLVDVNQGEH